MWLASSLGKFCLTGNRLLGEELRIVFRYRRRDTGRHIVGADGVVSTNRDVVPYNRYLSRLEDTHVNVECCFTIGSVKYLFKYVHKGHDRATFAIDFGSSLAGRGEVPHEADVPMDVPDQATTRLRASVTVGQAGASWVGNGAQPAVNEIDDFVDGRFGHRSKLRTGYLVKL